MKNLRISIKVALLAGSLLLLAAILSVTGYSGTDTLGDTFKDYRSTARTQMLVANISEDLAKARINGLKLRLTGNYAIEQDVLQNLDAIASAASQIADIIASSDIRKTVESLLTDVALYRDEFVTGMSIQDINARESYFVEKLDVIGPMIAVSLDSIQNDLQATQNRLGPEGEQRAEDTKTTLLWTASISIFLGIILSYLLAVGITRPVTQITETMDYLATSGDTSKKVRGVDRKDEIGRMARSLEAFRRSLIEKQRADEERARMQREAEQQKAELQEAKRRQEEAERLAKAQQEEEQRRQRHELRLQLSKEFETEFKSTVEALARTSLAMADTASDMMKVASKTASSSENANSAASTSSMQVNEVSTATTQMSSATQEISQQVVKSSNATDKAAMVADASSERIASLNEAAMRITEVVELISDIAEQTNLLALNATIEAARAGEAGKGFAVVASEVKSLAVQTASATQDIDRQVSGMRNAVDETVESMRSISSQVGLISDIASGVASAVEEQTSTVQQIAHNTAGAADETEAVASAIDDLRQQAMQSGEQARTVFESAKSMTSDTSHLLQRVDDFMQRLATS